MLPFVAQGAGMAIEDAAVLAKCLGEATGDHADIAAALGRYAALRAPRVTRVQRTARQSGEIYHLRGPMALARDMTMRMLGADRLQARQDWIYDWRT
jgi:salicylate hydroxylase